MTPTRSERDNGFTFVAAIVATRKHPPGIFLPDRMRVGRAAAAVAMTERKIFDEHVAAERFRPDRPAAAPRPLDGIEATSADVNRSDDPIPLRLGKRTGNVKRDLEALARSGPKSITWVSSRLITLVHAVHGGALTWARSRLRYPRNQEKRGHVVFAYKGGRCVAVLAPHAPPARARGVR